MGALTELTAEKCVYSFDYQIGIDEIGSSVNLLSLWRRDR